MVALDQFLADELDDFGIDLERFDVDERDTEFLRRGLRDDSRVGQFAFYQVLDEGHLARERVLERAHGRLLVEQTVIHELARQTRQGDAGSGHSHVGLPRFAARGESSKIVDETPVNNHRAGLFRRGTASGSTLPDALIL